MTGNDQYQIIDGFPRCVAVNTDGFETLKTILGLNRTSCRRLIENAKRNTKAYPSKLLNSRLSSGERDRLLLFEFYEDKSRRYDLWAKVFALAQSGKENQIARLMPSLEHRILLAYLNEYDFASSDTTRCDLTFADWPDLISRLKDSVPWAGFAASVWSGVRGGLDSDTWDSLGSDERTDLTMVLFAVATIVDDVRILRSAIKAVPTLQIEFDKILYRSGTQAVAKDKSVLQQWTELCESLRSLSEAAARPQTGVDSLDEIKELVNGLVAIEPEVREGCIPALFDHLMSRVNGFLHELEQDGDFAWFQEGERTRIRSFWTRMQDSLSLEQVRTEIVRLDSAVRPAVDESRELALEIAEAEAKREALSENVLGDLAALHSWERAIEEVENVVHALRRSQRKARIDLLGKLSPFGEIFKIHDPNPQSSDPRHVTRDIKKTPSTDLRSDNGPGESTAAVGRDEGPPIAGPPLGDAEHGEELARQGRKEEVPPQSSDSVDHRAAVANAQADDTPTTDPADAPGLESATRGASSGRQKVHQGPDEHGGRGGVASNRCLDQVIDVLSESPPRLAYAVQVSRLSTRLGLTDDRSSAGLFEVALLADHLNLVDGEIAADVTEALADWRSREGFSCDDDVHVMLAIAAALRPAILLPQTDARAILSSLKPSDRLATLYQLVSIVAESCRELSGVQVDSVVIKSANSDSVWTREREQLSADVNEWLESASHMTLKYAPATNVWQCWLSADGIIAKLIALIVKDCHDNEIIKEVIAPLQNARDFNQVVRETDRTIIGRRTGPDIEAGALTQLFGHAQKAVRFVGRQMSLNETRPSQPSYTTRLISRLRDRVDQLGPVATKELRAIADTGERSFVAGAANVVAYAIDRFRRFLKSGDNDEPNPQDIFASALFRYPSIPVDSRGFPACGDQEAFEALIRTEPVALEAAADTRLAKGDFETVRRIIDWSEVTEPETADSIRSRMAEERERVQRGLRCEIDVTRTKIESALLRGHIQDPDRDTYEAQLVEMEGRIAQPGRSDFGDEFEKLNRMASDLEVALDVVRRATKGKLDRSGIKPDSSHYAVILDAIEGGDIITADELTTHAGEHPAVPTGERRSPRLQAFSDFYPVKAEAIQAAIESRSSKQIIQEISTAADFGTMQLNDVPPERRRSAHRMLLAWYSLKHAARLRDSDGECIHTLFSELGFVVREVRLTRKDTRALGEAIVETDPLDRRERCPVPEFGSSVNGIYRVLFLWGGPAEEDILQHADESGRQRAAIAFYFGDLGTERRAILSRLARERAQSLLVVDELLLLYLCSVSDSRVPILFSCSLPLTYVQPYVTTGGLVPPEMFYGRGREMRIIADQNGSCFIYGGRQLGKTAVLRAVESREHRPSDDSYAVWIDLKHEGIGYDRVYETGVAGIWSAIWRTLNKKLEIPDDVKDPNPNNPKIRFHIDRFIEFLISHFNKSSRRRLLLLLDEADKFLEIDARQVQGGRGTEYRESTRLKGLMDHTERSIKVVFAGLHNVLRTAESSNHPLGHFGQPIQIGPLWSDAHALILEPLTAAGYPLHNESHATRIIARTNYYPHLIQIYGSELVKSMANRISGRPPYPIPEKLIEDTYLKNANLREEFRQRFRLTLQLDRRYEVIAYTVADECSERDAVLSEGLDYRQIEDRSRYWWPEGFEDVEPRTDRFRSLLDEMVGLGVLRRVGDLRYTLRNPNVLTLMGTEEVADILLRDRDLPSEVDPSTFRAHDPKGADSLARSPLTYQQEGALRAMKYGVSIVCGLPASGYGGVLRFLARDMTDSIIHLRDLNNHNDFERQLVRHSDRRSEGTTIYVIPDSVPWSEMWVEEALGYVRRLSRRGRRDKTVRILFMADAAHLLQLHNDLERFNLQGLEWVPVRPWRAGFILQWMDDVGVPDAAQGLRQVATQTGGWWIMIRRLYELVQETRGLTTGLGRLDGELRDPEKNRVLQTEFGLDCLGPRKRILEVLAHLNSAEVSEIQAFAEDYDVDEETILSTLKWAEMLHLSHRVRSKWEIDGIVGRLLAPTNE